MPVHALESLNRTSRSRFRLILNRNWQQLHGKKTFSKHLYLVGNCNNSGFNAVITKRHAKPIRAEVVKLKKK